jgi:hypothetical protein
MAYTMTSSSTLMVMTTGGNHRHSVATGHQAGLAAVSAALFAALSFHAMSFYGEGRKPCTAFGKGKILPELANLLCPTLSSSEEG